MHLILHSLHVRKMSPAFSICLENRYFGWIEKFISSYHSVCLVRYFTVDILVKVALWVHPKVVHCTNKNLSYHITAYMCVHISLGLTSDNRIISYPRFRIETQNNVNRHVVMFTWKGHQNLMSSRFVFSLHVR